MFVIESRAYDLVGDKAKMFKGGFDNEFCSVSFGEVGGIAHNRLWFTIRIKAFDVELRVLDQEKDAICGHVNRIVDFLGDEGKESFIYYRARDLMWALLTDSSWDKRLLFFEHLKGQK